MLNINEKNPEKAIKFLIEKLEGIDLTDNKDDNGGLTKFGISKNAYPDIDIENLEYDEAVSIYIKDYWNKSKCDVLLNISEETALFLFFNAVNFGSKTATIILQKAINDCFSDPNDLIFQDGIIGKNTIKAIVSIKNNILIDNLILETALKYAKISNLNSNDTFLNGWFNRLRKIIRFIK